MKRNKLIKILMCSFLFTFTCERSRAQGPSIPGKHRKYGDIKKNIHLDQVFSISTFTSHYYLTHRYFIMGTDLLAASILENDDSYVLK